MKNLTINVLIKAKPADVYAALTNPALIEIWTGEPAIMSTEPNSEFSWWDGDICGVNIAFTPNKRIEQKWFFDEIFSHVIIVLNTDKKGTYLHIVQDNIPDDDYENMEEGWNENIISGLKELLEE